MPLPKAYDPSGVEEKQYTFWEERGDFRGHVVPDREPFSIVIPPPNVTGELHIGHALNNALQDVMIRYKRMSGYEACWFPGMDHAGIATQNVVERELADEGLSRDELGREAFVERVWAWKDEYARRIRDQLKALGCSCDWDRERFTLDEGLSRAVIEVFVRLYEEGHIYRGERMINWCPRCQTALSDIEVEHEERQGQLYHIRYPIKGGDGLIVATTRPETMLADTAVAVHPADERNRYLIGKTAVLPLLGRELPVIADEWVDREFGTGVLKVTPGHDPTDFEIGGRHGLEAIHIFHADATTNEQAGPYQGLDREEARKRVVEDLEREGLLAKREPYTHAVGQCQRCHTPVEPVVSEQWFVRMEELAKPAIEAVRRGRIRLIPERWAKIYFDWMENIQDWCISRQLWWGHRIPAWHCRDCAGITVSRDAPIHCSSCGSAEIDRDADVLDTWFSSALWPFSIMGWPEETPELRYFYPTSLLITASDIIFFWVARMIMMGLHFMEAIPFQEVLFHPIVKDTQGRRMSKSLGTGIDPLVMKERYGMDALRFTLASRMTKGQDLRLSEGDVEGSRKFLNKIWNAARFALMNLEDESTDEESLEHLPLRLEDRWMLSQLGRTIATVREALDDYDFNVVGDALYDFVWHRFCDWYLELIKPRLSGEDEQDKRTAQRLLHLTLKETLKLLHPVVPFLTEELWQRLPEAADEAGSVMVAPFPRAGDWQPWIDAETERSIAALQEFIGAIRTMRSELRVPPELRIRALVRTEEPEIERLVEEHGHYFQVLARVEELEVGPDVERPQRAPRQVFRHAEVFLPLAEVVDLDQQRQVLERELDAARNDLESVRRRLDNTEFLERAPREVIEKEKERSEELTSKVERLEENLELLGTGSGS